MITLVLCDECPADLHVSFGRVEGVEYCTNESSQTGSRQEVRQQTGSLHVGWQQVPELVPAAKENDVTGTIS